MCELAEFERFSLTKKRSKEVTWALELPVPISYSYVVQKKNIFKNILIINYTKHQ